MPRESASATVTAAWIGLVGVVTAALIGGAFALAAAQRSAPGGNGQPGAPASSTPPSTSGGSTSSATRSSRRSSSADDRPGPADETTSASHEPAGFADEPSTPALAQITLIVGIRPDYSELAEDLSLLLDGRTVAHWQASQLQPSLTLPLQLPSGSHRYSVRGTYQFMTPTGPFTKQAAGFGTVEIIEGSQYGMPFYPATQSFGVLRIG